MDESSLMIVVGDVESTRSALHSACALSRRNGARVILLKMTPVRHPYLLGDPAGYIDLSCEDTLALADMAATAEDYGVPLDVHVFQFASFWSGVLDAAEQLAATTVIIQPPASRIPFWQQYRLRRLQRQLARRKQALVSPAELSPMLEFAAETGSFAGRSVIAMG